MISVLIVTKNEEQNLPGCLENASWSNDVRVLDSYSTDRTVDIATKWGAVVSQRPFDTFSKQRNALIEGPMLNDWFLILDPDERLTPELIEQLQHAAAMAPPEVCAFRVRRRDYFQGTWLKHAQISPFQIRLCRRGQARYIRDVNEIMEVDGKIVDLTGDLDHFPFSKGIGLWLEKHNTYSAFEARIIAAGQHRKNFSLRKAFFEKDFHERRIAQKALFYRMPARPLFRWCYMMFARGAFLDGRAGLAYANLQAIYEYMIVLKTRELIAADKPSGKTIS
jgi:glycosyltransferase involved in cell wall biosynthesis